MESSRRFLFLWKQKYSSFCFKKGLKICSHHCLEVVTKYVFIRLCFVLLCVMTNIVLNHQFGSFEWNLQMSFFTSGICRIYDCICTFTTYDSYMYLPEFGSFEWKLPYRRLLQFSLLLLFFYELWQILHQFILHELHQLN